MSKRCIISEAFDDNRESSEPSDEGAAKIPEILEEAEFADPFAADQSPLTLDPSPQTGAASIGPIGATPAAPGSEELLSKEPAANGSVSAGMIPPHDPMHVSSENEFSPSGPNEFSSLDERSVTLDRITSFIVTAVVATGVLIAIAVSLTLRQRMGWWWLVIPAGGGLFVILLAWLAYYWPGLTYRFARYRLAETGLEIRRGVLWRHQISVPAARVQHVDVSQGPLQRQFGLASLVVHTAGTSNASVTLEGLAFETAQALRDELIRQRESLDVI